VARDGGGGERGAATRNQVSVKVGEVSQGGVGGEEEEEEEGSLERTPHGNLLTCSAGVGGSAEGRC